MFEVDAAVFGGGDEASDNQWTVSGALKSGDALRDKCDVYS